MHFGVKEEDFREVDHGGIHFEGDRQSGGGSFFGDWVCILLRIQHPTRVRMERGVPFLANG